MESTFRYLVSTDAGSNFGATRQPVTPTRAANDHPVHLVEASWKVLIEGLLDDEHEGK